MATTTTNFGWTVPQSTDLVKDGATAISTLGSGIDTSMVDLKGGTTGQVLSKTSGTDMDFTWVANESQTLISTTTLSGASTTISGIPATYKDLKIIVYGVNCSSAGLLQLAPNASTTITDLVYNASGTPTSLSNSAGGYCTLLGLNSSNTTNGLVITISDYASTVSGKPFQASGSGVNNTTASIPYFGMGRIVTNSAISSLVFNMSSGGTFSAGTVKVFGVK